MEHLYCNPLEIAYKYQHPLFGKYAYKEAADPTVILFQGKYFLFTSKCGGFYYSDDLFHWDFHEDRSLEIHGYAPDVSEHDGWLYFCASSYSKKSKILRSRNPFEGFEQISAPFAFWDPHLYFEGKKAYLYWGCSSKEPICATEMDIDTMTPIGDKASIVSADKEKHGVDNKDIYADKKISLWQKYINLFVGDGAFIEGAFLNKFDGTYYFQYATPGTEFPTYSDAVLIGDSPLGKFTWQKHNPYSIVPSGFTQGAGHGSTFYDKSGNLWHASTVCVGVNHNFERRLGLWPAGIDKDGLLFCNQYFADYPKKIPEGRFEPLAVEPEWMLLSYQKEASASSFRNGYNPEKAFDESIKSAWSSESGKNGEWLCVDLGKEYEVMAVQVNFADCMTKKKRAPIKEYGGTFTQERYIEEELVRYEYRIEYSKNGTAWSAYGEKQNTTLAHKLISCQEKARFIRIVFDRAPYGQNFSVSGLRVFGVGNGEKPERVCGEKASRKSNTVASLSWNRQSDAVGYCIRLGIAPDKLYNSILLYGQNDYTVTFLNKETEKYYFAVDAFNENGITKGTVHKF